MALLQRSSVIFLLTVDVLKLGVIGIPKTPLAYSYDLWSSRISKFLRLRVFNPQTAHLASYRQVDTPQDTGDD